MRRFALACLLLAGPFLARPATAHHVMTDHGIAAVVPRSMISVDTAAAHFDLQGTRGNWQTVTPTVEWALWPRVSFMAALPLARLSREGKDPLYGQGDLSLSGKVAVFQTAHGGLLLSAGLGLGLPTGNTDNGLGGGHVGVSPFVTAASQMYDGDGFAWVGYVLVAPRLSLGGDHHHHHHGGASAHVRGSLLAPHGEGELFGRAMTGVVVGRVTAALGAEGSSVWDGDGRAYVAPRFEFGVLLTNSLRLFSSGEATVWGERRFEVRARAGVAWWL